MMGNVLSPNTQAILLLTAPLLAGRNASSRDLLSPGEYRRLARHLHDRQHQPADLLSEDAKDLIQDCEMVVDRSRLERLLGRGFLLSQVVERWQTRAIWVVSRADSSYPRRLKKMLREDAPALLYGCGDVRLLETGGLAVVGSRHVDDALINYAMAIGQLAASAGRTLVSGGAKGIDQAAMRGAIEASGKVIGVVADDLEATSMNREHRNLLIEGQLALTSPFDPSAGFNVGHAMQRNKVIYALAQVSLVVSSDLGKGGTWTGAVEQLDKLKLIPVYIRSTGDSSVGLSALRQKGALLWPNPKTADALEKVFDATPAPSRTETQTGLELFTSDRSNSASVDPESPVSNPPFNKGDSLLRVERTADPAKVSEPGPRGISIDLPSERRPASLLFAAASQAIRRLLSAPMTDAEVAAALEVSNAQAKAWLRRLVHDEVLEKLSRPARYVIRSQATLLHESSPKRSKRKASPKR